MKSCIYIAKSKSCIKVGVSHQPDIRLQQLKHTSSLDDLTIWFVSEPFESFKAFVYEQLILKELSEHRLTGEWFSCSPETALKSIKSVIKDDSPLSTKPIDPVYVDRLILKPPSISLMSELNDIVKRGKYLALA